MRSKIKSRGSEYLLVSLFLFTYAPIFIWMWDRWFVRDSYYSHGILIPFVSGYLIWQMRDELAAIKRTRSPWGMPLILIGLIIHMASSLFRIYFTAGFSLMFVLSGLVLFLYGSKTFKKIIFPICFLLFMIPMPLVVITNISFKMKLLAAQIATGVLNKMGLEAVRSGSILKMQHAYVIVDDICSGLRSLISLTALGSMFAWWMKAPIYRRIFLFLLTIPIAIVTNVLRIVFLSFVSEVWGPQYATGFIHDLSGFMVFGLAFVLLYSAGKVLE